MKSTVLNLCCLILFGLVSTSAFAEKWDWGYESITLDGLHFEKNSQAVSILEAISRYRGRALTADEVAKLTPALLRITGEQLVGGRLKPGGSCFTGMCRVLTPTGYRPIRDFSIGDAVLSVDVQTGKLSPNPIISISRTQNQVVGELKSSERLGEMIEVTPTHLFFSPSSNRYRAIGGLYPDSELLEARSIDVTRAELSFVRRGTYVLLTTSQTVYNLHLKFDPNNFCVETLVVHNMTKEISG